MHIDEVDSRANHVYIVLDAREGADSIVECFATFKIAALQVKREIPQTKANRKLLESFDTGVTETTTVPTNKDYGWGQPFCSRVWSIDADDTSFHIYEFPIRSEA
jgi:hypothetical protein